MFSERVPHEEIKRIENFFFIAMNHGYCDKDAVFEDIGDGGERFRFAEQNLLLRDAWYSDRMRDDDGQKWSEGTTTIWDTRSHELVWRMTYQGRYSPEVHNFLKEALLKNYIRHVFYAGRGPQAFQQGNLVYNNRPTYTGFDRLDGLEIVHRIDDDIHAPNVLVPLGWHSYSGGFVIPPKIPKLL